MPLPTFLVLGAGKAGTTSLRSYLQQHPEIFMCARGEPSFFAHEGQVLDFKGPGDDQWRFVTDLDSYTRLFDGAAGYRAVGEVSPRYLFYERAGERIEHHVPTARLIAILRHPVDRAYSHFLMNRERGCEPEADLQGAISREAERMRMGWSWDWSYVEAGRYGKLLERYYRRFPGEQIKVFLYEELQDQPGAFFQSLFEFLGVNPSFRPNTDVKHRLASSPRSASVETLLRTPNPLKVFTKQVLPHELRGRLKAQISAWNTLRPEPLSPSLRQALFEQHFADDCLRLEALIDRDLSAWMGAARHARYA